MRSAALTPVVADPITADSRRPAVTASLVFRKLPSHNSSPSPLKHIPKVGTGFRTKMCVETKESISNALAQILRYSRGHFVSCLNDLGVHFIGTLCRNQISDFLHRIDVRCFEITLLDRAIARITRDADQWAARSFRFAVEIAAQWLQTRFIGEVGKCQLTEIDRLT